MTERVRHLTITLDQDYREDDVKSITSAIKMIRGVARITERKISAHDYFAREPVKIELKRKILEVLE